MILRTTSQPRSRSTALLVGEVAMRSIDGEVVSKLRLEKEKTHSKAVQRKIHAPRFAGRNICQ